jgi:hypothetical protein
LFRQELRKPQGDPIAVQKSADGIIGQAVDKAIEALQSRKAEQRIGRAETMTEGPNDRERQVGLSSHERIAAENAAQAVSGAEREG